MGSAARRGRVGDPSSPAAQPLQRQSAALDPPQRPVVGGLERVERAAVHLRRIVGRQHEPVHDDQHALSAQARVGRRPHRVGQVSRTVEASFPRVAHGAHDHHGCLSVVEEVPGEGRLLEDIGALHDHDARDLWPGGRFADALSDVQQLGEAQVRGRHEAPVHDLQVGGGADLRQTSEELRAPQRGNGGTGRWDRAAWRWCRP